MKVEDVLWKIGDFGLYQKSIFLMTSLCMSFLAIHLLLSVFIAGMPNYRCRLGITDTYSSTPPFNGSSNSSECGEYDTSCHICRMDETSDNFKLVKCDSWVYDDSVFKSTVISEFDLVCGDEIKSTHVTTMFMTGAFLGSLFAGICADTYGRRTTLLVSLLLQVVLSFAMVFVPGYAAYAVFRGLFGFVSTGASLTMGMIPIEMVGLKWRNTIIMGSEFFFPLGMLMLLTGAYFVRDWRMLVLAMTFPLVLLFFVYLRYLPESMRWLISKKRFSEAHKVMMKIAKVNKSVKNVEFVNLEDIEIEEQNRAQFKMIFSSRTIVIRCLSVGFICVVLSMAYYGISLNTGVLTGNLYANFFFLAIVEVPGYAFGFLMLDRIGRRKSMSLDMAVAGLSCLGTIIPMLIDEITLYPLTLVFVGIGKFGLAAAFGVSYLYVIELFPTSLRNTFLGFASSCVRLGSLFSTYIVDSTLYIDGYVGRIVPLLLFGVLGCLSALVALKLPETCGTTMPESFEEAENIPMNMVKIEKVVNGTTKELPTELVSG